MAPPEYDPAKRREALRTFIEREKLSVLGWTKKAGLTESSVRHFLAGRSDSLNDKTYESLAYAASRHLNRPVSANELRGEQVNKIPIVDITGMARYGRLRAPSPALDDFADFAITNTAGAWAPRPPSLARKENVTCFQMPTETMAPWRETGDLVYMERHQSPHDGSYVVLEGKPFKDDNFGSDKFRPVVIGRLIKRTKSKWTLRQYKPRENFEIDARTIKQIYRVIDWPELLGVNNTVFFDDKP